MLWVKLANQFRKRCSGTCVPLAELNVNAKPQVLPSGSKVRMLLHAHLGVCVCVYALAKNTCLSFSQ